VLVGGHEIHAVHAGAFAQQPQHKTGSLRQAVGIRHRDRRHQRQRRGLHSCLASGRHLQQVREQVAQAAPLFIGAGLKLLPQ
jgi:hypothetical protein